MSLQLNRRSFLRGVAGALLPLPYLNLMEASTRRTTPDGPPLRFVTLFKPNGVHPPSWNISGGTEHDFRLSPLMQPFARHRDDLLILDNLGDFGFSSHSNSTRRFLSGHHDNVESASIDQIIADHIGGDTRHRSLELTTEGLFTNQIGCSYISYDKNGQPIPRESDPQLVFDRLFRDPLSHPDKRAAHAGLIDRVREDARSLSRHAGRDDQQTLDEYLTAVREAERRIENLRAAAPAPLDVSRLQRPPAGGSLDDQVNAMIDLIALALWTDSTRCVSYMLGNSNSRIIFDFLGVPEQHHYLSHFFRNFSRANLDGLLKITLWHMEKFDRLLSRLKSYRDQDGSLLDHSIVLFGSGMGHSDNHTATRIPTLLAGNGAGRLRTGRYLRYAENQPLARLHLALLQQFGVPADSYGGASSPLPGLDGAPFLPFQERPFDSWVRRNDDQITARGRLRLSEDLNEARIFYLDIDGIPSIRIDVPFRDFHHFNLAYHSGTPVTLTGSASEQEGRLVISRIQSLESVFGKQPGTRDG